MVVVNSRPLQERKALSRGRCWGLTSRSTADTGRLEEARAPEIAVQPETLSATGGQSGSQTGVREGKGSVKTTVLGN